MFIIGSLALTWGIGIRNFGPVKLRNQGFLDCGPKESGISGNAAGVWNFGCLSRDCMVSKRNFSNFAAFLPEQHGIGWKGGFFRHLAGQILSAHGSGARWGPAKSFENCISLNKHQENIHMRQASRGFSALV